MIETVTASDAMARLKDPDVFFVDLRDVSERSQHGQIQNAVVAPRGYLELYADPSTPMYNPIFASGKRLLLYCASGGPIQMWAPLP